MKPTFLQKKIHPSVLAKSLLEKHDKRLLWNSGRQEPTARDLVLKKLEPIRGAE